MERLHEGPPEQHVGERVGEGGVERRQPRREQTVEEPRLQAWLFDRLFAPWLPPLDASLAYALAYVLLWWALMEALHRIAGRSGWRLRV